MTTSSGWVLLDQDLFWTSNSGETWQEIGPSVPIAAKVQDVVFRDSDSGWVLRTTAKTDGSAAFTLTYTSDHGGDWDIRTLDLFDAGEASAYAERAGMGWFDASTGWIAVKQTHTLQRIRRSWR